MTDGQLRGQKHTHWRSCPIPISIFLKSELPLILYFAWSLVCLILPIVAWNVWQRLYSRWTFFWIDLVSGHTGYVPLVFQAKSGSILKNWYIFCCILDEGDILLSLILRLPEMRPTFARNRLASRWMRRYNKQRCEFLGPSAILAEYTYALEETSRPKGHPRWAYEKSHAPNQSPQCDDTNYFVGKRLDELLLGLQCLIRAGSTTAARPMIWYPDTFVKLHLAVAKITSWSSWKALSFIQKHAIIGLQFEFLFTSSCREIMQ